jgi:ribosomal protein L7/L12
MSITLNKNECAAILDILSKIELTKLLALPDLLSAIMKLNGSPLHEPGMGMPYCGNINEDNTPRGRTWIMADRYVALIKHVRYLSGYGLKEAKDFVDAACDRKGQEAKGFFDQDRQTISFEPDFFDTGVPIDHARRVFEPAHIVEQYTK